jgi:hypothetical protein
MTSATRLEFDEHGHLRPFTVDQCLAVFTEWAGHYPSARFVVIAIEPDGSNASALGWGLALPDHVVTHLPALNLTGMFRTADDLIRLLRPDTDARVIWVDPEPEQWPDESDD